MKKSICLAVAFVLLLSLSAAAFAENVASSTEVSERGTVYYVPNVDFSEENDKNNMILTEWDERGNVLTSTQHSLMDQAEESAKGQILSDNSLDYLFYAEADTWPQTIDISKKLPEGAIIKEYTTDGTWVDVNLSSDHNAVTLLGEGVVAIYVPANNVETVAVNEETSSTPSPEPSGASILSPTASSQSSESTADLPAYELNDANIKYDLTLTSYTQRKLDLVEQQRSLFESAKACVGSVTPQGSACQYLFHVTADAWPQELKLTINNAAEVTAKEYTRNGKWVDIPVTGTYSLHLEQEGVVAIFTK